MEESKKTCSFCTRNEKKDEDDDNFEGVNLCMNCLDTFKDFVLKDEKRNNENWEVSII